jgi:hypothetical protein
VDCPDLVCHCLQLVGQSVAEAAQAQIVKGLADDQAASLPAALRPVIVAYADAFALVAAVV